MDLASTISDYIPHFKLIPCNKKQGLFMPKTASSMINKVITYMKNNSAL
jgi:hypothetical protein